MVQNQIEARGIRNPRVLTVMRKVERHLFVKPQYLNVAYKDGALPIDCDQTISQPYIVALMTELLELTPTSKVLEIGTGCGYQTAVLAELAKEVYSIEIIPLLAKRAKTRLEQPQLPKCPPQKRERALWLARITHLTMQVLVAAAPNGHTETPH